MKEECDVPGCTAEGKAIFLTDFGYVLACEKHLNEDTTLREAGKTRFLSDKPIRQAGEK